MAFMSLNGIDVSYDKKKQILKGLNLEVEEGELVSLLGPSGCGKSTFVRMVISLDKPTSGEILYHGKNLAGLSKKETWLNRQNMQMVFQDPYASLNPRMTVMEIIKAPLDVYKIGTKEERIEKVLEMAKIVGLNADAMNRYPHEFSGGATSKNSYCKGIDFKSRIYCV